MLRVTLEMVPFGDERRRRTLGTLEIANTTPFLNAETGQYRAHLVDEEVDLHHELTHWPRKRGAWHLTHAILEGMFGKCPMTTKGKKSQWRDE